jgi:hypothetical protein
MLCLSDKNILKKRIKVGKSADDSNPAPYKMQKVYEKQNKPSPKKSETKDREAQQDARIKNLEELVK